ncbi:hypothetical protein [Noviherbaspirillum sp. Root189]|uniref:hypothetical protein n=1 Tax=Noviherbaspirillum sp. Root189 TaxID=1736487 RepID=UPI000708C3D4|nr:hypothetical protein [Noviherbaspirillum sp. Root189]KRB93116.1 hypothetical protein ASE07_14185 [Noviherbaspirillum sp. Root189]
MFIEIGDGWHVNLAHIAKIHVVDQGGAGTILKLYSLTNDHLGDFNATSPEELMRVLNLVHSYGKIPTPE